MPAGLLGDLAGDYPSRSRSKALFAGVAFEAKPKRHTLATALPWIMAIALYSCMRLGEVCEQDGVPYFDIGGAKGRHPAGSGSL